MPADPGTVIGFPLTHAQQRIWQAERVGGSQSGHAWCAGILLAQRVDDVALANALDALVARHEALRTKFRETPNGPLQCVEPAQAAVFSVIEVEAIPDDLDLGAPAAISRALEGAVDLEHGPVFSTLLFREPGGKALVVFRTHQAVFDGQSLAVVLNDLAALLTGRLLAPPPLQLGDFAAWQRSPEGAAVIADDLRYWGDVCGRAVESFQLPYKQSPLRQSIAQRLRFVVDAAHTASLRELARSSSATPFAVLIATWRAMCARSSETRDACVFTAAAGRAWEALAHSVGFYSNLLTLRTRADGNTSFCTLLERERDTLAGALRHQTAPFDQVLQLVRPAAASPLLQVSIQLAAAEAPAGLPGRVVTLTAPRTRFDVSFTIVPVADRLELLCDFDAGLLDSNAMQRIAHDYIACLFAVAANPLMAVSELPPCAALSGGGRLQQEGDPADPLEGELRALFESVLGVSLAGSDADFLLSGGHSLLAVKLLSRVRDCYRVSVSLTNFFAQPTPAALAALIRLEQRKPAVAGRIPLRSNKGRSQEEPPLA